jgi:hypothetical protein
MPATSKSAWRDTLGLFLCAFWLPALGVAIPWSIHLAVEDLRETGPSLSCLLRLTSMSLIWTLMWVYSFRFAWREVIRLGEEEIARRQAIARPRARDIDQLCSG